MSPKYSRRGYLPRNKPLSNRLRVQTIKPKRKASKRSRPTSPPDHPPRRDHPPRASTRALVRSLRRTFPFDQRGTSQPSTRSLDRTVHSRVRRPAARAAGHEEFKRTLAPRRAYTFRLCDYDRRRRVPRVPTQLCAAPRCPPAPLDGSIPTPPFTRDPPPDRPPSRPPLFTISRNQSRPSLAEQATTERLTRRTCRPSRAAPRSSRPQARRHRPRACPLTPSAPRT